MIELEKRLQTIAYKRGSDRIRLLVTARNGEFRVTITDAHYGEDEISSEDTDIAGSRSRSLAQAIDAALTYAESFK